MQVRNKDTGEVYSLTPFDGQHELVTLDEQGVYQIAMRGTTFEIALGMNILVDSTGDVTLCHPSAMANYEVVVEE